jgi:hypothetical protein
MSLYDISGFEYRIEVAIDDQCRQTSAQAYNCENDDDGEGNGDEDVEEDDE